MLQISSIDEGKSEWISETQLLIPMGDSEEMNPKEIDGLAKQSISLNSLDGTDQTLLANGHTLVIGLDRTLFENYHNKSDILLMQNSDVKLLPSVTDSKLSYSLASVDAMKNELAWEGNTYEKPNAKDILNVIQETSKCWNELGKSVDICLEDINAIGVHENKINNDFLVEPHILQQSKRVRGDSNEYIVGYYPVGENCDAVLVPTSLMALSHKTEDCVESQKEIEVENDLHNAKNLNQLFFNENIEDNQSPKWKSNTDIGTHETGSIISDKVNVDTRLSSILKISNTPDNTMILGSENLHKINNSVIPLIDSASDGFVDSKPKNETFNGINKCEAKDGKVVENENSSLPEQSLPLKKKAKMKKSPVNGNNTPENLNELQNFGIVKNFEDSGFGGTEKKSNITTYTDVHFKSDQPFSKQIKRKSGYSSLNFKKKKKIAEEEYVENFLEKKEKYFELIKENEKHPFKNIIDLLDYLKNEKLINDDIFKILKIGLNEMGIDILQEMYRKRDSESNDYSSHLKAFALMLHFKQPNAFNRLGELFKTGWPSLNIIKDWKRRLNSHRKPKTNANLLPKH